MAYEYIPESVSVNWGNGLQPAGKKALISQQRGENDVTLSTSLVTKRPCFGQSRNRDTFQEFLPVLKVTFRFLLL
jgi:hypothetical protein